VRQRACALSPQTCAHDARHEHEEVDEGETRERDPQEVEPPLQVQGESATGPGPAVIRERPFAEAKLEPGDRRLEEPPHEEEEREEPPHDDERTQEGGTEPERLAPKRPSESSPAFADLLDVTGLGHAREDSGRPARKAAVSILRSILSRGNRSVPAMAP
jgi:hypothetical protein